MRKPDPTNDQPSTATPSALKRGQSAQVQRDKRSKLALKANMARRKAQVRARDTEAADHGSTEYE